MLPYGKTDKIIKLFIANGSVLIFPRFSPDHFSSLPTAPARINSAALPSLAFAGCTAYKVPAKAVEKQSRARGKRRNGLEPFLTHGTNADAKRAWRSAYF